MLMIFHNSDILSYTIFGRINSINLKKYYFKQILVSIPLFLLYLKKINDIFCKNFGVSYTKTLTKQYKNISPRWRYTEVKTWISIRKIYQYKKIAEKILIFIVREYCNKYKN